MHNALEQLIWQKKQEKPLKVYEQGLITLYKYLGKERNVIWYNQENMKVGKQWSASPY